MKKISFSMFFGVFMIVSFHGSILRADHEHEPFHQIAHRALEQIWQELNFCNLYVLSANDPRLPRPLVRADKAIINRHGRLLAYYAENLSQGGYELEFKNPNGSYQHTIQFSPNDLNFRTPYQGNVAHANRFFTPQGPDVHYYCMSRHVALPDFLYCVEEQFIHLISYQLCRFRFPS